MRHSKTGIVLFLVLLHLMVVQVASAEINEVQILMPTNYHGDELPKDTSGEWYGIYTTSNGYELRKTPFQINTVRDEVLDDPGPDAEKTGKEIVFKDNQKPLFMIRGLNLSKRKLKTAAFQPGKISVNETRVIEFNGNKYGLSVSGISKDAHTTSDLKIIVQSGTEKEILFSAPPETKVEAPGNVDLIWAGDLDGDDKLDLFIQPVYHYNTMDYQLFLSSKGQGQNMMRMAARLVLLGC